MTLTTGLATLRRLGVCAAAAVFLLSGTVGAQTVGEVGTGPLFNNPRGVAEAPNGDLIVADFGTGNIIRVDGTTGDRTLLSEATNDAQGVRLNQPAGAVVLDDGRIFISDLALAAVVEIDPANGNRTRLTNGGLLSPFGIAAGVIRGKTMLVVADTGNPQGGDVVGPVLVDPDTGAVSAIRVKRDNQIQFNDPRAVAVVDGSDEKKALKKVEKADRLVEKFADASDKKYAKIGEKLERKFDTSAAGTILIANFGEGTIIAVDPVTGERTVVSSNPVNGAGGVGTGPNFGSMSDIAISDDGNSLFVMDLGNDALVSVNLANGNRSVVSTSAGTIVGGGDDFRSPHGIEVVAGGFIVTDFGLPGLIKVAANGDRSLFSVTPVEGFTGIRDFNIAANGQLLASDFGGNRIFQVDPVSGVRTLISGVGASGTLGTGVDFNGPVAVLELSPSTLAVAQFQNPPGIFAIDRATGNRSKLAGLEPDGQGVGPEVASRGFTLDPGDASRILATSVNEDAVIAVDIATGNRSFVSKDGVRGSGPALNSPSGIVVDPADGTIYVSDFAARAIFKIDVDGNRTVIAANGVAGEPDFGQPFGIDLIDGVLWIADNTGLFSVDPVTGAKALVSNGGRLFSVRRRDADTVFVSNFGTVNGIEIVNKTTGERSILSNATNP